MQEIEKALAAAADFVWGPPLLILLFGTHLFLTVRLRFIQRYLGTAIRISFRREKEGEGDVSQFGALMTALAATIGTGNIVGVATAVAAGGPGAVLWMWLTGVFGIATKYAEAVLAVKYRVVTPSGDMGGGPTFSIRNGAAGTSQPARCGTTITSSGWTRRCGRASVDGMPWRAQPTAARRASVRAVVIAVARRRRNADMFPRVVR